MRYQHRVMSDFARIVTLLAVIGALALVVPTTPASAAGLNVLATKSGLARGDYRLTIHVTAPSTPVNGSVVEQEGGTGPLLRVASFTATSQGTNVIADVRSTGPADIFYVITNAPSKASKLGVKAAAFGTVVRGTKFVGADGSARTWHGTNTDPWITVPDISALHAATKVNIVRIPISECVWMPWNVSYLPNYRQNMINIVNAVTANGMTAIVDLHWACHDNPSWQQPDFNAYGQIAPDQHSIDFWKDAASVFKNDPNVMFELFNEPQLVAGQTYGGKSAADVWLNGGTVSYYGLQWQAPGMQTLYDAVRSTGADNVVLADGLEWASDLRLLTNGFALQGTNVAYAYHAYTHPGQDPGAHTADLDTMVWPSIDPTGRFAYAAMATEFGTDALDPTATSYFTDTINWFTTHGQSWAVWGWYPVGGDLYALLTARPATTTSRGAVVLAAF